MAAAGVALSAAGASKAPSSPVLPLDDFLLLRDQVRGTFAFNRTSLTGHFVGALVIELIFADTAPKGLRLAWGVLFALVLLVRLGLAIRFSRDEPTTVAGLLTRLRVWQGGVLVAGALWGSAAWFFYGYGTAGSQLALVLVVYTFCVASVPILAPQFAIFVVFALLVFVPTVAVVALRQAELGWQLGIVMAVAMGMIMVLARNYRESFDRNIELKLRTEALAVQLRAETSIAEEARREAEVANRAKTQFFTAASHDLRQPLHAMGLFAEALRQRVHEPEVAQLVNSINESVDALEGLFSELLDITRIDSGGVEVNPESFEVGDIFRKLRLHFEPAAFEKGLRAALSRQPPRRPGRPAAGRAHPAQPRLQRHPLHHRRVGAGQRASTRRSRRPAGLGHRAGHPRRRTRARLRGVLSAPGHGSRGHGRAEKRPRPRPGHRQAPRRPDGRTAGAALGDGPRLGLQHRAAARQGAARRRPFGAGQGADRHHAGGPADRGRRGRAGSARGPRGAAAQLGRDDRVVRERRRHHGLGGGERPLAGQALAGHRRLSAAAGRDRRGRDLGPARALRQPRYPRSWSPAAA